jgi:arsenate reductase (thioredoxin)
LSLQAARLKNFVPLFSERFARQRLRALARVEGKMTGTVPSVVFLCTHNAGRSQMAAASAKALGGDRLEVFSGGSDPASEINPAAIEGMREVGIDIKGEFPKPWTDEVIRAADVIVTMGCGDACPIFPGKRYEDWEVEDPAGQDVEHVRPIRDDIESRVRALLIQLGVNLRSRSSLQGRTPELASVLSRGDPHPIPGSPEGGGVPGARLCGTRAYETYAFRTRAAVHSFAPGGT